MLYSRRHIFVVVTVVSFNCAESHWMKYPSMYLWKRYISTIVHWVSIDPHELSSLTKNVYMWVSRGSGQGKMDVCRQVFHRVISIWRLWLWLSAHEAINHATTSEEAHSTHDTRKLIILTYNLQLGQASMNPPRLVLDVAPRFKHNPGGFMLAWPSCSFSKDMQSLDN